MDNKTATVILGAGFGGLRAAMILAKRNHPVILIDKNNYHTYTPILYELSVISKALANNCDLRSIASFPISDLISGLPISFINDEVTNIDINNNEVILADQKIPYKNLILALGSETNYYNIPGLKENSLSLKSFLDAMKIRDEISSASFFESKKPTLIIGGGGSTGVELAGEIQLAGLANVMIIQRPPNILEGFNDKLKNWAEKRLGRLGVRIILDTIIEVKAAPADGQNKKVILKNSGETDFDFLIWTGGIKSNSLIEKIDLKKDEYGHLIITKDMKCRPTENIYAIGDMVCLHKNDDKIVPCLAQSAIEEGTVAAKNILRQAQDKFSASYEYKEKEYPYILPVGGKYAIFQYKNFVIDGLIAWILKGLVELNYLIKIMPFFKAFRIWFKGLKIFLQNEGLG